MRLFPAQGRLFPSVLARLAKVCVLAIVAWCSLAVTVAAQAAEAVAPVVPTFARFHGHGLDPTSGGQLLLGELNCTSCHAADKSALNAIHPKQAPILDHVGLRVRPEYLKKFLTNPLAAKPGTTMPDPFTGYSDAEREAAAEALTHFLATTGMPTDQRIPAASIGKGQELFHRVGCVACHNPQKEGAEQLQTSVPIGKPENKYTLPSLTQFLNNPRDVRPSGRMPSLNLQGDEARDIAAYLMRDAKDLKLPANLKYAYYEGSWQELPDFTKLTPKATGETSGFDLAFAERKDEFGVRFTGTLQIPKDGEYTFHLTSDDGSKLYIDDKLIVSHDNVHAPSTKSGKARLKAGLHPVVLDYFEFAGGEEVSAEIQGNGIGRQPLDNFLVAPDVPNAPKRPQFVVDPALAAKGRELFVSVGCASCHQMQADGQKLASNLKAPELASLKNTGGCMSATPSKVAPTYALNEGQRTALAAGIHSVQKPVPEPTSHDKIASVMRTFNCYACHQRGELGGVEPARDNFFLSTQKEMGDEGRLPPPLTGVGGKLKPEYLKQLFELAMKERPYMLTRMPRFGSLEVDNLHKEFTHVDPTPELKVVDTKLTPNELRHGGYLEVGSKGYSCIKCHNWGGTAGTGIQSINMQRMTTRLKQEWFEAYVVNPQQFRPGTRMPSAWPDGNVLLPKLLDGQLDTQVRGVWTYLSDGEKARIPLGLGRDPIELAPESEPIIYRNFIEGSGARAIGVGYPEKLNLSFDANQLRLAMIWQGAFMDASKHWIDRGAGYQPPLGDNVLHLTSGAPLAVLADETTAWPTTPVKEQGFQFRGYRLDKKRQPTFLYSLGDVQVSDEPLPITVDGKGIFRRTFTLTAKQPVEHLYLRAAVADDIKPTDGEAFTIDGKWTLRLPGMKPVLRKSGNKSELLIPISFTNGQAKVVQEYAW